MFVLPGTQVKCSYHKQHCCNLSLFSSDNPLVCHICNFLCVWLDDVAKQEVGVCVCVCRVVPVCVCVCVCISVCVSVYV